MDPIANSLAQIKNAIQNRTKEVVIPFSKQKVAIFEALKNRKLINDLEIIKEEEQKFPRSIKVKLSFVGNMPKFNKINRISRPGRRIYVGNHDLLKYMRGKIDLIVSTSSGIMSGYEARKKGLGGEVICEVE